MDPRPRGAKHDAENHAKGEELAYLVFAIAWAISLTLDKVSRGFDNNELTLAVPFVAMFVLAKPSSVRRLAALALVHLAEVAYKFDAKLTIHWLAMALADAAIVTSYLRLVILGRSFDVSRVKLWETLGPSLRWLGITGMFCAGFAKLNTSFLDPELSCAVALYEFQRVFPPYSLVLPSSAARWVQWAAIAMPLTAELLAPLLLMARRTRWIGVLLCSVFLTLIATNSQARLFAFAGPMLSLVVVPFVAPDDWRTIAARWRVSRLADVAARVGATRQGQTLAKLGVAVALFFMVWMTTRLGEAWEGVELRATVTRIGFGVVMVSFISSYVWVKLETRARLRDREPTFAQALWRRPRALLIFPLLLAVNDLTIYLGFYHHPSFTMAGNLVISPEVSNHVVVRDTPHFSASRIATIHASSDKRLRQLRGPGRGVSWIGLRDYLARNPETSVTFELDGVVETIDRAGDDPRFQSTSFVGAWLSRRSERAWGDVGGAYRGPAKPKACHHDVDEIERKRAKQRKSMDKRRARQPLRKKT